MKTTIAPASLQQALGPDWVSALADVTNFDEVINFALFVKNLPSDDAMSILALIKSLREADADAACPRFHGVRLVRLPKVTLEDRGGG